MVSFDYLIKDSMGLHARPVGILVKAVSPFKNTKITIEYNGKVVDAKRMLAIMCLQVKQGDTIKVSCDGEDEQNVSDNIYKIFCDEKL